MTYALVFSGQGTQHPEMLPWLAEDENVRSMNALLGTPDWRAAAADQDWASRNQVAQPLLAGLQAAAWHQLAPALPPPAAIAGYSVGEIAAFAAAGVYNPSTALALARVRAEAMDRCAARTPGGLLAASGLPAETLERFAVECGLSVAIRNGPDSLVLGGPLAALAACEHRIPSQGGRCTRLRIGVASHTPAMGEAAEAFRVALAKAPVHAPTTALFTNAADRVRTAPQAADALAAQIAATVRWTDCMDGLHARGVRCVLEIGPGQALARLWNERYPDAPARSCDEFRSAAGVVRWVLSHRAQ
jgi:[acyl-carrier-protein] S-malonyltransferase